MSLSSPDPCEMFDEHGNQVVTFGNIDALINRLQSRIWSLERVVEDLRRELDELKGKE